MRKSKSKRQPSFRIVGDITPYELSVTGMPNPPGRIYKLKTLRAFGLRESDLVPPSAAALMVKLGMSLEEQRVSRMRRAVERYANNLIEEEGLKGKVVFRFKVLAVVPGVLENRSRRDISPEFL